MDWNWFYSSFSQSAAAMLSIIGAFIISKLIGIEEKVDYLKSKFSECDIDFINIQGQFSLINYYFYNRFMVIINRNIEDQCREGVFKDLKDDEICDKIYLNEKDLFRHNDGIIAGYKIIEYKVKNPFSAPPNSISPSDTDTKNAIIKTHNKLMFDAKKLIREFDILERKTSSYLKNLNSVKFVILMLIVFFPIIVIFPLYYLPLSNPKEIASIFDVLCFSTIFSIKGLLLLLFCICIETIFVYFLILLRKIRLVLIDIKAKDYKNYKDINSYCKNLI